MKAIHKKRLLNVAKALRESPVPKAFTMRFFGYIGDEGPVSSTRDVFSEDQYNFPCGTPACALGHYAARRDLQRHCTLTRAGATSTTMTEEMGHFGLDDGEYEELFGGMGCGGAKTVKQAAKYIENFVKEKES